MTSPNNIDRVRKHLFDALDGLASKETPLDLDRAKAISEVAQTIINSAKVEVDYLRVSGSRDSRFLEPPLTIGTEPEEPMAQMASGIVGMRQHRLVG